VLQAAGGDGPRLVQGPDPIGQSADALFADHPEIAAALHRCLREQTAVQWERAFPAEAEGVRAELTCCFCPPDQVMLQAVDVTARRRAAERQGRSAGAEAHLLRVLAHAPLTLTVFDQAGRILFCDGHAARELGQPVESLIGKTAREAFPDLPGAHGRVLRALAGDAFEAEVTFRGRTFEVHYLPERNDAGAVVGACSIAIDVTDEAEATLRLEAVETSLRRVVTKAPLLLWAVDREGIITLAEGRALERLGLRTEEALGRSVFDLSRGFVGLEAAVREALAGTATIRVVESQGVVGEVHLFPDRDEHGEVVGATGLTVDLTDKKRAEAALQESQALVHRILTTAPVVVWAVDLEGRYRLIEGSGLAGLGLTAEPLQGMSAFEAFADAPLALEPLRRALAGEASVADVPIRDRWFTIHYYPDRDAAGTLVGASGLAMDVTMLKGAESALRASEERFHQLADQLSIGLWISTPDSARTVYTNPAYASIYGHPREHLPTREEWLAAIHPEDRARVDEEFHRWELESPKEAIYRIVRPDGGVGWIRDRAFTVRDKTGATTQVAGLVEDLTELRRIEAQVRRVQDRLADAQRLAHVGNWDWDVVTGEVWWSEETYRIFGRDPAEPVAFESFLAAIHVDEFATVSRAMSTAAAEGTPLGILHRITRPGGAVRVVETRGEIARDAAGRPSRMLGTVQDLTEKQATQEALAMLSSAVEQAADLIYITDPEGRIRYVNPAFEAHTGYARGEAIGATPRILAPESAPADRWPEVSEKVRGGSVYRGVVVNRKKDGTEFSEEKSIAPIRDEHGRVTHLVSVGRDITERTQAQEARDRLQEVLAKAAAEWKATFDAVESPFLLVDRRGLVRRLNRAARTLWGIDYQQIIGRPVPADRGEPWKAMASALASAQEAEASVSVSAEDEAGRTWDVVVSPVPGPDGEWSRTVLARDISGIVELQKSLRRSERMSAVGALVAGVAHEVRNPLFGISAALDAFDADFKDRPEYRECASLLRAEVERLTSLMQSLLDYGRPATTERVLGPLGTVVGRAVQACAPIASRLRVTVAAAVPSDLPPIRMEPERLLQVFQNVIENAIQHAPAGTEVTVSAAVASVDGQTWVSCSTADGGPGFRPQDVTLVFEPFFTRRRGGTGLGLSIVQKIVYEHGGTIVASNRPEGGALVTVRLPAGPALEP
jgi:PAS domain S-box-containing protein